MLDFVILSFFSIGRYDVSALIQSIIQVNPETPFSNGS